MPKTGNAEPNDTTPSREFMPRLTMEELNTLSPNQFGIIMRMQLFDPNINGNQLKERVAELLPPELHFGDDVRAFADIHENIRNYLNKYGVNTPYHSSHRIVRQLANGLYDEAEGREIADRLALDIQRGRLSFNREAVVINQTSDENSRTESAGKIAENVAMRLKHKESKSSNDTTESTDFYVEKYRQIARDYSLPEKKSCSFCITSKPKRQNSSTYPQ